MRVTVSTLLAVAACAWFQFSYFAYADGVRIEVRHLELNKPEVAAQVYARIEKSAWILCRDSTSAWDSARARTLRSCVSRAIEAAVQQANVPQLTAFHDSRQHGGLAGLAHH